MKAAVIKEPKKLVIEDVPKPECRKDEVLIQIKKASFCNETDHQIYHGSSAFFNPLYQADDWFPKYPHILGHEFCGRIVEKGNYVKEIDVEERVSVHGVMTGAFSEYVAVKPAEVNIIKLDLTVEDEEGALMEPVVATMKAIYSSGMRPGDKVAILGQGAMGLLLLQEAKALGALQVVTTDLVDFRVNLSKALGADLAVNARDKKRPDVVREIMDRIGPVDVLFDTVGNDLSIEGQVTNTGLEILKRGGRYFIYGFPSKMRMVDLTLSAVKEVSIFAERCPLDITKRLIGVGYGLVRKGAIKLKPLISHRIELDDVKEGLDMVSSCPDKVIKVVVNICNEHTMTQRKGAPGRD